MFSITEGYVLTAWLVKTSDHKPKAVIAVLQLNITIESLIIGFLTDVIVTFNNCSAIS
jgi:hypothetical protein